MKFFLKKKKKKLLIVYSLLWFGFPEKKKIVDTVSFPLYSLTMIW